MGKKEIKKREESEEFIVKKKRSNSNSLKPPTRVKKGIKNLIVCFFRLKPKKKINNELSGSNQRQMT